jgi:hypothetical protein
MVLYQSGKMWCKLVKTWTVFPWKKDVDFLWAPGVCLAVSFVIDGAIHGGLPTINP